MDNIKENNKVLDLKKRQKQFKKKEEKSEIDIILDEIFDLLNALGEKTKRLAELAEIVEQEEGIGQDYAKALIVVNSFRDITRKYKDTINKLIKTES